MKEEALADDIGRSPDAFGFFGAPIRFKTEKRLPKRGNGRKAATGRGPTGRTEAAADGPAEQQAQGEDGGDQKRRRKQ
jgi:hypothetical protein